MLDGCCRVPTVLLLARARRVMQNKLPVRVCTCNGIDRTKKHLGHVCGIEEHTISLPVSRRDDGDMVQHRQRDVVARSRQTADPCPVTARPSQVTAKTGERGNIQQHQSGRSSQSLRQARGVIAIDDPSLRSNGLVVKLLELVVRTGLPRGSRKMVELIQVYHRQLANAADRIGKRRLATIGWTDDADALAKCFESYKNIIHLTDPHSGPETLTTQFVCGLIDGLMAAITLALLFFYSVKLALIIACGVVVYGILRCLYFATLKEANLSQIVVNAKQQTAFMESVRGSQTIRLFNQGAGRTYQQVFLDNYHSGGGTR